MNSIVIVIAISLLVSCHAYGEDAYSVQQEAGTPEDKSLTDIGLPEMVAKTYISFPSSKITKAPFNVLIEEGTTATEAPANDSKDVVKNEESSALLTLLDGIEARLVGAFTLSFANTVGAAKTAVESKTSTLTKFTNLVSSTTQDLTTAEKNLTDAKAALTSITASNELVKNKMIKQLAMIASIRKLVLHLKYPQAFYLGFHDAHVANQFTWADYGFSSTKYAESNGYFLASASGNVQVLAKGIWNVTWNSMSYNDACNTNSYQSQAITIDNGKTFVDLNTFSFWCSWTSMYTNAVLALEEGMTFKSSKIVSRYGGNEGRTYYVWHGGEAYSSWGLRYLHGNVGEGVKRTWMYQAPDSTSQAWANNGWTTYNSKAATIKPDAPDKDSYFRHADGKFEVDITGYYRVNWSANPWFDMTTNYRDCGPGQVCSTHPDSRRAFRIVYCSTAATASTCRVVHALNHFASYGKNIQFEYTFLMTKGSMFYLQARYYGTETGQLWTNGSSKGHWLAVTYEASEKAENFNQFLGGCKIVPSNDTKIVLFGNYGNFSGWTSGGFRINQFFFWTAGWLPAHCLNTIGHNTFPTADFTPAEDGTLCVNSDGYYRILSVKQNNWCDTTGKISWRQNLHGFFIKRKGSVVKGSTSDDWGRQTGWNQYTDTTYCGGPSIADYVFPLSAGQCVYAVHYLTGEFDGQYIGKRSMWSQFSPPDTASLGDYDNVSTTGYGNSFLQFTRVGYGGAGSP